MPRAINRRTFLVAGGSTAAVAALNPRASAADVPGVRVTGLKVDHQERPLGVESSAPRLSWRLESSSRNVRQGAYRILVASSDLLLRSGRADIWDSGRIHSRQSVGIRYAGNKLGSRERCWWCVQIWDGRSGAVVTSEISYWEMALLEAGDWVAQWLAIETPQITEDREFGLQWFSAPNPVGSEAPEPAVRQYRLAFEIQNPSAGAALFCTGNAPEYDQVIAIWVDGRQIAAGPAIAGCWFTLPELEPGSHVIAFEAKAAPPQPGGIPDYVSGVTCFARLDLANGARLRLGGESGWKTRMVKDAVWTRPEYDDHEWDEVRQVPQIVGQPWPPLPAMNLRREFTVSKSVVTARLYVTALGAYEARINGNRAGDALLTPEPSQYAKHLQYQIFDVARLLREGENALGLTVGDGWYASFDGEYTWGSPPRRALAQLEIVFEDGSRERIATGPEWRIAEGPIRESVVRIGEVYDARLEQPGWDEPGFNATTWHGARVIAAPSCALLAQITPPVRVKQIVRPISVSRSDTGVLIVDFGQNFAGWCRIRTQGRAGTRLDLRFAELLTPSGELDQGSYGVNWGRDPKRDVFILRGNGTETLEPHFAYRGFRYVEIRGLSVLPDPDSIEGVVIYSDLEPTGRFGCSSALIEAIWRATLWTQRSNFVGIPTDCPGREQRGWTADAGVFWDTAAFNMDVSGFTIREMKNIADDQTDAGEFPVIAPAPRLSPTMAPSGTAPGWGDAGIILPWTSWWRYGDTDIIERNWESMSRYVQYIHDRNPNYLWQKSRGDDFGDWLALDDASPVDVNAPPSTPKEIVATAYWAHSADLLAQMARAIGRPTEADRLATMYEAIRSAFKRAFVKPDGTVGNGSQAGQILALKFGLVDGGLKRAAAHRLAVNIRERGTCLTTGFLGTQFSLDVLADAGFADIAYELLFRREFPSWGYMIGKGSTTIWEHWRGEKVYDGKSTDSQNHFALAGIGGFLFRRVAGIDAETPGFEKIRIRPIVTRRVMQAGASYNSIKGLISTNWSRTANDALNLDITIPANTTATVHIPALRNMLVAEGGHDVSGRDHMRVLHRSAEELVVAIGSGSYAFTASRA